ncbi:MAG: DEAD/DEAH box helicase [Planctomycetota bacterium]
MDFDALSLPAPLRRALQDAGYATATPIQAQAIPPALEGRDVLGCAQTGTGKTAAFALPLLARLYNPKPTQRRRVRALVLSPTRELAVQIVDALNAYAQHTPLSTAAIYGGVGQRPQVRALTGTADIIVATPGRLIDLMEQGHANLTAVRTLVLDEADRMLDMGFTPAIRRIVAALPAQRQTLLFSATMPKAIRKLAADFLNNPAEVHIAPQAPAAERIEQSVCHVHQFDKPALLVHYFERLPMHRTVVFTRTKHGADRVVKGLRKSGIHADAIHGNKTQNQRQRALDRFRNGAVGVLVATDVAARGIDVDDVTHVVNYDLAQDPESYVHRIGRTARAGAQGHAIALCDPEELPLLRDIERHLKTPLNTRDDGPGLLPTPKPAPKSQGGNRRQSNKSRGGKQNRPTRPTRNANPTRSRNQNRNQPADQPTTSKPRRKKKSTHRKGQDKPAAQTNAKANANTARPKKNRRRKPIHAA